MSIVTVSCNNSKFLTYILDRSCAIIEVFDDLVSLKEYIERHIESSKP